MYMLAAGAAAGAMNAIASLKDLFAPSSSSPSQTGLAPADPFALASGSSSSSAMPAHGAGWNCMTPETMRMMISMQSQTAAGTALPGGGRAAEYFAMLDTNADGSVSKDELQAALTPSGNADKTEALFGKLDANNDGTVSEDELEQALRASHHHHHRVDAEIPGDAAGGGSTGGPLQGTTSKTVTNSDGSTTTTISYADGSSVSLTRPAAEPTAGSNTFANNLLERLIQRQAQMLAVTAAGQGLSVSA